VEQIKAFRYTWLTLYKKRRDIFQQITRQETAMKWETPSAIDLRFGFEITMYIANR
jgi:coenzyme PQQ precursor peptide PqqA